jgi:hypothetical protein
MSVFISLYTGDIIYCDSNIMTYNDITSSDITSSDITYKDITYKDITYNTFYL